MAAHWHLEPRYLGYASAFSQIVQTEGYGALYHGIRPTLAGIVPYAGCSFAAFHTIKAKLREVA
jgi:solute carrier family 25 protein 42